MLRALTLTAPMMALSILCSRGLANFHNPTAEARRAQAPTDVCTFYDAEQYKQFNNQVRISKGPEREYDVKELQRTSVEAANEVLSRAGKVSLDEARALLSGERFADAIHKAITQIKTDFNQKRRDKQAEFAVRLRKLATQLETVAPRAASLLLSSLEETRLENRTRAILYAIQPLEALCNCNKPISDAMGAEEVRAYADKLARQTNEADVKRYEAPRDSLAFHYYNTLYLFYQQQRRSYLGHHGPLESATTIIAAQAKRPAERNEADKSLLKALDRSQELREAVEKMRQIMALTKELRRMAYDQSVDPLLAPPEYWAVGGNSIEVFPAPIGPRVSRLKSFAALLDGNRLEVEGAFVFALESEAGSYAARSATVFKGKPRRQDQGLATGAFLSRPEADDEKSAAAVGETWLEDKPQRIEATALHCQPKG